MMTDGDALLAAVIAAPDDDTLRLVYADWLQENGDHDRAEFIRVQVELAGLTEPEFVTARPADRLPGAFCRDCGQPGPPFCGYHSLRGRSRELLGLTHSSGVCNNHTAWAGPAGHFVLPRLAGEAYQFSRGFVESVSCPWEKWLSHVAALVRLHPVRKVTLTTWPRPRDAFPLNILGDKYICPRWPGVEFVMPAEGSPFDHSLFQEEALAGD